MDKSDVIVIGAGPAGMMAAITAAKKGVRVILLEKNHVCGEKLLLTGHGRCNITNLTSLSEYSTRYFENGKFLISALHAFSPEDIVEFFDAEGLHPHIENDILVFPHTEKAIDVRDTLLRMLTRFSVHTITDAEVVEIAALHAKSSSDEMSAPTCYMVTTADGRRYSAPSCIVTVGGATFPQTGSNGKMLPLLHSLGHTSTPLLPSLAPILCEKQGIDVLAGLSLSDVDVELIIDEKTAARSHGDILFTHTGLSGPAIMRLARYLPSNQTKYAAGCVALRFAFISRATADECIMTQLSDHPNMTIGRILSLFVPNRLAKWMLARIHIDESKPAHDITKEERKKITAELKEGRYTVTRQSPMHNAFLTRGGITLSEVSPKTMASKINPGLFFAGEVLDIDGESGGFNLQAAWSTGYVAGESAATHARMTDTEN
ncbi:MAG TPA: NAD(P)/FAD-dependent oxidoreductase [Bacillota bacterium]|nr:NAD(P)/FAD-dependent oxidoreductase [Bacillota bacterium]HPE38409.1 NAD(P)/FAD-dependent oxidoreductase [Bacillota bacterium]